jgi:hydroxymethylpyrimidine/phosphomethylpyrimidine kinase
MPYHPEMEHAAYQLLNLGSPYVLLKGGHLKGSLAQDILVWHDGQHWFKESRIQTRNTHGTGCTLSAAITACLAQGEPMIKAIDYSKTYLTKALKAAAYHSVGKGSGSVHHFYHLWPTLHKI